MITETLAATQVERIDTPLGPVTLHVTDGALCALRFGSDGDARSGSSRIAALLVAYFAGRLDAIDAIPVAAQGTPFQRTVWAALRRIPVGETVSYAELARTIGRPTAARAVARANAQNPIAVVVPCHRVIGSDDRLRGYAYGLERKAWLLAHEGCPRSA